LAQLLLEAHRGLTQPPNPELAMAGSWLRILHGFSDLAGGYWRGAEGRSAWALLAGLLMLNAAEVGLLLRVNTWNRDLFDALERRDGIHILVDCGIALLLLAAGFAVASCLNLHARRRLAIGWRRWLTERLTADWLASGSAADHANADGRIAEDARIATEEAIELISSLSHALITLACFVGVLWQLSAHPPIVLGRIALDLPGYLLWVAVLYAGCGTAIAGMLARPLVRATDHRQTEEASYRATLVLAQQHGPAMPQRARLGALFGGVVATFVRQTRALGHLQLFGAGNVRLGAGLPLLAATPAYLAGVVTLGWVMQAAQAFQEVARALSWPVDQMPRLATWRASAARVVALHRATAVAPWPAIPLGPAVAAAIP
jgi:putative ATP-binding cassette transporter